MARKHYDIEKEGQIDFFDNYGIDWQQDESILVENTDGIYNGNIFEFKTDIPNLNKVLIQAIKYCSRLRIKGKNVPATILLIDLNATKAYKYSSKDYINEIQKVYIGAASKDNVGFIAGDPDEIFDYSEMLDSSKLKKLLIGNKKLEDMYIPIDIDENCIVGWAERYYREKPTASKGDFLGDDTGKVKITGEIREPKHFKGLINAYTGKSNEKFKYLMDCLNDRLSKKDLGAFYTPIPYCQKAAELVQMAVDRVPDGNDYIILDRCAGTGNLESALIGLYDKNGDELISHCVISTYEYYEYKVLNERLGDKVRDIIPPTEADVVYENGKVSNADAMSKDFIDNPIIKEYLDNPNCAIILFENPPYHNSSSSTFTEAGSTKKAKSARKDTFVGKEFRAKGLPLCTVQNAAANELSNLFIWSGFEYYMRQPTDSYIVFSPVQYFKNIGLVKYKLIKGFAFNRKHFHASDSVISCMLWANIPEDAKKYTVNAYDILENELVDVGNLTLKKVYKSISSFNDRRKLDTDKIDGTVCSSDGEENYEWATKNKIFATYGEDIIAYIVTKGFNFGAQNVFLHRVPYTVELYKHDGYFLRKDVYLQKLPIWVSKYIPRDLWYEKDIYNTTADSGDKYTRDANFLKSCLIYTCLSNQNKCLSFVGSDGRWYQNELCFDVGTLASADLSKFTLDNEEKQLIKLWKKILEEARATGECNPDWKYGVYQITKDINTSYSIGSGKNKKNVYDHPELNGDLDSLRSLLKAYYKSHITAKMFEYELIK